MQVTACSRWAQAALQQHQHCIALLSHRESGSSQHHTAVKSCLQIPGSLHCRVTDRAQHASHSMQQMGTSSTASSSALYSIADTTRDCFITASYCCTKLLTNSYAFCYMHSAFTNSSYIMFVLSPSLLRKASRYTL